MTWSGGTRALTSQQCASTTPYLELRTCEKTQQEDNVLDCCKRTWYLFMIGWICMIAPGQGEETAQDWEDKQTWNGRQQVRTKIIGMLDRRRNLRIWPKTDWVYRIILRIYCACTWLIKEQIRKSPLCWVRETLIQDWWLLTFVSNIITFQRTE